MRRSFNVFILVLTAILLAGYGYLASRLCTTTVARVALLVPFLLLWIVPIRYWGSERSEHTGLDDVIHFASYVSMGWLNFIFFIALGRDLLLLGAKALDHAPATVVLGDASTPWVVGASFLALACGMLAALRGPGVLEVTIPIAGLDSALSGFRIAQISDLHVGPTIGKRYVERVVALTNELKVDLVALTGDFVDGTVERLAPHVKSLADLRSRLGSFFCLGNHEYYSGARQWSAHFDSLGIDVLQNEGKVIDAGGCFIYVGGVVDPMAASQTAGLSPRPDLAMARNKAAGTSTSLSILLAHNPKLAPKAAEAGFDVQLSGHTHAGQFFPWNFVVKRVHAPHVAGLSREGAMWVYVSAGTGSWGPPIRFGTKTELTLITLRPG